MKWKAASAIQLPDQVLEEDFRQAWDAGKGRLGTVCLYYTKFSGTLYLPYEQVDRAWLRQEEVNAKLCCGQANFDQFFLIIQDLEGNILKIQVLNKERGKEALERITAACPQAKIGYQKPEAAV